MTGLAIICVCIAPICPVQVLGGAATCLEGFVICFLRVPLACLGSMAAAVKQAHGPGELSENSLQNLRNKWPPHPVEAIDLQTQNSPDLQTCISKISNSRLKNCTIFQDYFPELVNYMISGEVVAVCLARKDGIERWKAVMGPPDVR